MNKIEGHTGSEASLILRPGGGSRSYVVLTMPAWGRMWSEPHTGHASVRRIVHLFTAWAVANIKEPEDFARALAGLSAAVREFSGRYLRAPQ